MCFDSSQVVCYSKSKDDVIFSAPRSVHILNYRGRETGNLSKCGTEMESGGAKYYELRDHRI